MQRYPNPKDLALAWSNGPVQNAALKEEAGT